MATNSDAIRQINSFPDSNSFRAEYPDAANGKYQVYTFPSNLGTIENRHFMSIAAIDQSRSRDTSDADKIETRNFYNFPLPRNITTGLNAGWETVNVDAVFGGGFLIDLGKSIAQNGLNGFGGGSDFLNTTLQDVKNGASKVTETLANAGLGLGLRALANASSLTKSLVSNIGLGSRNYSSQFFDGMGLREFTFTWEFLPKSYEESVILREMEKSLKVDMTPSTTAINQFLIKYPCKFLIIFNAISSDGIDIFENTYLPKLRPCVLTSAVFQFNGSGVNSFHSDLLNVSEGSPPLSVSVALQFRETELLYSDDFKLDYVR